MNNGDRIYIERAGNGYIVRPQTDRDCVISATDVLVFNDLGYASQMRDDSSVPSLLGFIQDHFGKPAP